MHRFYEMVLYAAVLMGGVMLLAGTMWYYRRRVTQARGPEQGWTLQRLWQMRAAGQTSDEEFERLKVRILAGAPGTSARTPAANDPGD